MVDPSDDKIGNFRKRINKKIAARKLKLEVEDRLKHETVVHGIKAREARDAWYEARRAVSEKSATVILQWFQEAIISPVFQALSEELRRVGIQMVTISGIISCEVPSPFFIGKAYRENQSLGIDLGDATLRVHNHVKYGQSHQLKTATDYWEHVEPQVLAKVAASINDGSIWDIIDTY